MRRLQNRTRHPCAPDNAFIAEDYLGKKPGETLFVDDDWTADRTVQPLTMNEEGVFFTADGTAVASPIAA